MANKNFNLPEGLEVLGSLSVDGNATLGNANTDLITFNGRFNTPLIPSTTNSQDLGTSLLKFKDLHIAGTANIPTLAGVTSATITGGSVNGTTIGATTRSTGAFTSLAANGAVTFTQNASSTTTGSGTLVVTGGVGISENLSIGGAIYAGGVAGTSGFVLTSTGTGVQWSAVASGSNNTFSTIAVSGQSNVVADSTTDTLTLVAGAGVTITTNATTDAITIATSGGGGVSESNAIAYAIALS